VKRKWPRSPFRLKICYGPLFNLDNTDAHPDGFLSDVNPHSEQIFSNAVIDIGLESDAELFGQV
jgi:glutaminyl-tRNA synthetase